MKTHDKKELILGLQQFQARNFKQTYKELQMNYSQGDVIDQIKQHYRDGKNALKIGSVKLGGGKFKNLSEYFSYLREDFKQNKLPQIKDNLSKNIKMTKALVFWKFLREDYRLEYYPATRVDFVQEFVNDSNEYIALIAKIETLSDLTWRKILWRENIDFLSYESFLRRITPQQVQAIEGNFQDLEEDRMPRVYQKSFRDRMKVRMGSITLDGLRDEESFQGYNRYYGKGAWAFSLLGLDFGFGKFPKGIKNDTQIENTSPSRFFSIKEHVNDFVVNQEDGKYWWMYKNVRSNFAFRPKKSVSLSSHICPGFWATLIMHLLFWVVSPVVFATSIIAYLKTGASIALFMAGVSGLITPLWIILAMFRVIIMGGAKLLDTDFADNAFDLIDELIIDKFRHHGRAMLYIAPPILLMAIFMILIFSIESLPVWWGIMFAASFIFILSSGMYAQYNHRGFWSGIKELPLWKKGVGAIGMAPLLIQAAIWLAPIVGSVLVELWLSIVHFAREEPFVFWGFTAFFASLSIYLGLFFLSSISERFFAKVSRYIRVFTPILFSIGGTGFVFVMWALIVSGIDLIGFLNLLSMVIGLSVFGYLIKQVLKYSDEINLNTIDGLEKYQGILSGAKSTYSLGLDSIGIDDRRLYISLNKNKSIQGMQESSTQKFIFECIEFTKKFLSHDTWYSRELVILLLSKASPNSWGSLEELDSEIKYSSYFRGDRDRIDAVSMLLIEKKQVDEIYKIYEEKHDRRLQAQSDANRNIEKVKKFFSWIAIPFIWILSPFIWVYGRIELGLGTIQNLWELFNERCPTVKESRRLE